MAGPEGQVIQRLQLERMANVKRGRSFVKARLSQCRKLKEANRAVRKLVREGFAKGVASVELKPSRHAPANIDLQRIVSRLSAVVEHECAADCIGVGDEEIFRIGSHYRSRTRTFASRKPVCSRHVANKREAACLSK